MTNEKRRTALEIKQSPLIALYNFLQNTEATIDTRLS